MGSRIKNSIFITLLSIMLIGMPSSCAAGAEGGQDVNPDSEDVPFSVTNRTTPSQDFQKWTLTLEMDEEAVQNGTTFEISTQICLNTGVCDPPEPMDLDEGSEGGTYIVSLKPPSDHTYVNWRVKAIYNDSSTEVFPYGDWYKTWSTCWYDDGTYGGIHAGENGCDVPSIKAEEEESLLPFLTSMVTMSVVACAVIVYNKR